MTLRRRRVQNSRHPLSSKVTSPTNISTNPSCQSLKRGGGCMTVRSILCHVLFSRRSSCRVALDYKPLFQAAPCCRCHTFERHVIYPFTAVAGLSTEIESGQAISCKSVITAVSYSLIYYSSKRLKDHQQQSFCPLRSFQPALQSFLSPSLYPGFTHHGS